MDVAAPLGDVVVEIRDPVDDGHALLLMGRT
jgi:hypothetical protein